MKSWDGLTNSEGVTNPIRSFAFELNRQFSDTDNLVFSPLSISITLCILLEGARGDSRRLLAEILGLDTKESSLPWLSVLLQELLSSLDSIGLDYLKDREKRGGGVAGSRVWGLLKDAREKFLKAMYPKPTGVVLDISTGLWIQDSYPIHNDFKKEIVNKLGAMVRNVDIQGNPVRACKTINNWVVAQTRGRIKQIIASHEIHPLYRMVLGNAIYFNGKWEEEFSKPKQLPFYLLDGSTIVVPMMTNTYPYRYIQTDDYWAVEIPYVNRNICMLLIVPNSREKEDFFELGHRLPDIHKSLKLESPKPNERLSLTMPEFYIRTNIELSSQLSRLGLTDIFGTVADFSGISPETGLHPDAIFHEAFIDVDQYGTKAAVLTRTMVLGDIPQEDKYIRLIADHPLYFEIVDRPTQVPLFLGKVTDPRG
jgi:serpin B